MKNEGRLIYWNPKQKFGVIECRERWNGGIKLTKYFLHQSKITFMMGEPQMDSFVRFEFSKQPVKAGLLQETCEAEVYETREQMLAAEKGGEGRAS